AGAPEGVTDTVTGRPVAGEDLVRLCDEFGDLDDPRRPHLQQVSGGTDRDQVGLLRGRSREDGLRVTVTGRLHPDLPVAMLVSGPHGSDLRVVVNDAGDLAVLAVESVDELADPGVNGGDHLSPVGLRRPLVIGP